MYCKILKLSTGETIAGNVVEETSLYIDVMRPVRLIIAPKENSSMTVLFTKWDYTVDYELPMRIFKTSIVFVGEPDQQFKDSYKEMYLEFDRPKKQELSFEDEEDDLSIELDEIVNRLQKITSNTNNKTYH